MPLGLDGELLGRLATSGGGAWLLLAAVLGTVSGALAGLLGIGGGIVLVPGIALLLEEHFGFGHDLAIKTGIGTSLAVICFTSLSSLRAHARRDAVRWDIVRGLVPGIVAGGILAAWVARQVQGDWLVITFCAFVLLSAVRLLRNPPASAITPRPERLPGPIGLGSAGLAVGGSAALVGAGGAFISVPFMRWCGVAIHQAVGTSSALGLPVAVIGSVAYVAAGWQVAAASASSGSWGFVHVPTLVVVALASVVAAPAGARWAHRLSRRRLEQVFGILLVGLALTMLVRTLLA
jgi:uncharacterized protein